MFVDVSAYKMYLILIIFSRQTIAREQLILIIERMVAQFFRQIRKLYIYTRTMINLNKYYISTSQEISGQSVLVNYIGLKNIPRT